jgi:hypothetical protein
VKERASLLGKACALFRAYVAQKVHQSDATALKWSPKKIDTATGAQVNKLFVAGVANAAMSPGRVISGGRRVLAGAAASAVLAMWCLALGSPGAMALTKTCEGATGTSAVTGTPALLYLQCYKAIQIPGNPLQTFGGSTFVRKNSTTASYYLADRSNLGIDVLNGQTFVFTKTMTPTNPFIGQLIWASGPLTDPSTADTTRMGTADETHSGPNGMAVYTDAEGFNWLFVADGGCNALPAGSGGLPHGSTQATPSSSGTQGACGTPADPSTLPNPQYQITGGSPPAYTNCTPGNVTSPIPDGGCYPIYHQPNVKLFNLTNSSYVAGHDIILGGPGYGLDPSGNLFGASKADQIVIGTKSGTTYMLVSSPGEPFIPTAPQPTSGAYGACDGPTKTVSYPIPPFTSNPTYVPGAPATIGSFPYLTLFTIASNSAAKTANPPTVTYVATIRVDDTSPALASFKGTYGPFSCDYDGKRPSTAIGGLRFDPVAGSFFVALPSVFNNVPVGSSSTAGVPNDFSGIGQSYIPDGPPGSPGALATNTGTLPGGTVVGQGCVYQLGPVAEPNNSNSTQSFSGYFWTCDGGIAFFDPTDLAFVDSSNVGTLRWWTTGASQGVVKLPYCSPGVLSAGPFSTGSSTAPPGAGADYDNLFLGCTPRLNGNLAGSGPGVTVNISETYSTVVNVHPKWFLGSAATAIPGPFPPTDNTSPFNKTIAFTNAGGTASNPTPLPPGCTVELWGPMTCNGPGTSSYYQIPGGQIIGYPRLNTVYINGATQAHLFGLQSYGEGVSPGSVDMTTFVKDPHWYVAVGAFGLNATNITNLVTKGPVLAYLDALSNEVVEYTPTSSGSNTIAVDTQNYLAFLPVNGVAGPTPQLPAGDFTGNGVKLCGNGVTDLYGTVTGRGCVIVFREQYLSPIGPRAPK